MPSRGRILVIEDDVLLSMDVEAIVADCGFEVCLAGSLAEGLSMVKLGGIDAAVIDVNLKGTMSFPAADALSDANIPFLVLTGHSRDLLPARHQSRPFLQKPYKASNLAQAIDDMMAKPADAEREASPPMRYA